jgi:hypothetical protein
MLLQSPNPNLIIKMFEISKANTEPTNFAEIIKSIETRSNVCGFF